MRNLLRFFGSRGDRPRGRRWLILMYHRVAAVARDFSALCVPPRTFEAQIRFLKRHFAIASLDQVAERLQSGRGPETDSIVITFDDGYKDNYTFAFPILRKYGVPATVFLTTGHIGNNLVFWWDRVGRLAGLGGSAGLQVRFPGDLYSADLREAIHQLLVCSPAKRKLRLAQVTSRLKQIPDGQKKAILDDIERQLPGHLAGFYPAALSWDEVREMASGGVDFGSHTVTHPILTQVTPEQAESELSVSKREIESRLGKPVRHFAYPNGMATDHNPALENLLRKCGYHSACLAFGCINEAGDNPFVLKRKYIGNIGVPKLLFGLLRAFKLMGSRHES